MSYTSPLGRLPVKKTAKEQGPAIVPTELRLPDGRRVLIENITKKITNRVNYNLLNRRTVKIPDYTPGKKTAPMKYTIEERIWQSQATTEAIQERYGISFKQAQCIRYNSRYILDKLDIDTDTEDK